MMKPVILRRSRISFRLASESQRGPLYMMGAFGLWVVISTVIGVSEIGCYEFLALENFQTFYIVNSNDTSRSSSQHIDSQLEGNEKINVFDYHYRKRLIFYSGPNTKGLIRLFFGSEHANRTRIVKRPIILDVAVDWVQDKVYWIDSSEIHSVDLEGSNDQLVLSLVNFKRLKTIESFFRIAIDPYDRSMFVTVVTDVTTNMKTLFRSDLEGKYLNELPNGSNESVVYVKLDYEKKRIYQLKEEKGSNTLIPEHEFFYAMNYDGLDISEIKSDFLIMEQPFHLFRGKLLFISKYSREKKYYRIRTSKLYFYEVTIHTSGTLNIAPLAIWASDNPNEVRVFDQNAQLSRDSFYLRQCENMGCSYRCVVMPVGGATCVCPRGKAIVDDMVSCEDNFLFPIMSDSSKAWRNTLQNNCSYEVNSSRVIDYHFSREYMFYYNPSTGTIYRQTCSVPAVVIKDNVGNVLGLAVDSVHDIILWVDLSVGQLHQCDINGGNMHARPMITDLPTDIYKNIVLDPNNYTNNVALDPYKEFLFVYFVLKNGTYWISRFHLTSKDKPKINTGPGTITSITIEVTLETLYYAIQDTNTAEVTINSCNYDFEGVVTYKVSRGIGKVISISVLREVMVFIRHNPKGGYSLYLTNEMSPGKRIIRNLGLHEKVYLYQIVSAYKQMSPVDWNCLERGCSHICLDNATCTCPEDFSLSVDGVNCTKGQESGIQTMEITYTVESSEEPNEHENTTRPPDISNTNLGRSNGGVKVVFLLIMVIMMVMVGVLVYNFPWKDGVEPNSSEAMEIR